MALARRHLSLRRITLPSRLPDVALLEGVVSPRVLAAMRAAAERLRELRVRFALAGGLAVGAHGYPRATRDVDFLVGEEAFEAHEGGLLTLSPGVPVQVGDVPVDLLSIRPEEAHLLAALDSVSSAPGVPVLPLGPLVYLKLRSPRRRDAADVVEILRCAPDLAGVLAYVAAHAPDLQARLEALAAEAEAPE